jgi:hypothetical protein
VTATDERCPECGLPLGASAELAARRPPTPLTLIVGLELVVVGLALASVLALVAYPDSVVQVPHDWDALQAADNVYLAATALALVCVPVVIVVATDVMRRAPLTVAKAIWACLVAVVVLDFVVLVNFGVTLNDAFTD